MGIGGSPVQTRDKGPKINNFVRVVLRVAKPIIFVYRVYTMPWLLGVVIPYTNAEWLLLTAFKLPFRFLSNCMWITQTHTHAQPTNLNLIKMLISTYSHAICLVSAFTIFIIQFFEYSFDRQIYLLFVVVAVFIA